MSCKNLHFNWCFSPTEVKTLRSNCGGCKPKARYRRRGRDSLKSVTIMVSEELEV